MKKNDFNLEKYLAEAEEKFSGFEGEDMNASGDDDFDGDDFDGDDGFDGEDINAAGAMQSPTPYQLIVTNNYTTPDSLPVALFGYNQNLLATNFGSSPGLKISVAQANVTYAMLLQQSSSQPFQTSLIRLQSSNLAQLTQIINIVQTDANGQQVSIPLITQSYFSANQFQSTILDVPYKLTIDANTALQFNIFASTTLIMTLFPSNKFNAVRSIMGQKTLKGYGAPSVAIGIPMVQVGGGAWGRSPARRPAPRRK